MSTVAPAPVNLQLIGEELAISWKDGKESFLRLEFLRKACPCAVCGGEPDVMGRIFKPTVSYGPNSFQLRGFQIVGGYAIQLKWGDGHDSGLYTFSFLRRLSEIQS